MVNGALGAFGDLIGFANWGHSVVPEVLKTEAAPRLTLQALIGWIFAPLAFIIGIPFNEIAVSGALLGEKTILNEFVAFVHLSELSGKLSDRTFLLLSTL